MAPMETPGKAIKHEKDKLEEAVLNIVSIFENVTDVKVLSVHYYRAEPDTKLLIDRGKQKVDIILKL